MVQKSAVLRMVISHRCRIVHQSLPVALVERKADLLKILVLELVDCLHYIIVHILRLLRCRTIKIAKLHVMLRYGSHLIDSDLLASVELTNKTLDLDDITNLQILKHRIVTLGHSPLLAVELASRIAEHHVKILLARLTGLNLKRLHRVEVYDCLIYLYYIRVKLFHSAKTSLLYSWTPLHMGMRRPSIIITYKLK